MSFIRLITRRKRTQKIKRFLGMKSMNRLSIKYLNRMMIWRWNSKKKKSQKKKNLKKKWRLKLQMKKSIKKMKETYLLNLGEVKKLLDKLS